MTRPIKISIQILIIAVIHLLVFLGFMWTLGNVVINDPQAFRGIWLSIITGVYLTLTSPLIWVLLLLKNSGLHWLDSLTFSLIPINSILVASILRALYAGAQALNTRRRLSRKT